MSTAKITITAEAVRKEKERRKKGRGKGQGKYEKPAPNSSFQGFCRTCGKWRHKASECWQGYAQAVEEVPSSSASSVAPSATTRSAAAKTAASVQEFNDEHEPGGIFGVMGGSVASVTTGRDDLWDELVLDSGSVPTACPYAWCFGHQCGQRRQGVSARHSATQNSIAWIKGGTSRIVVSRRTC